MDNNHFGGRLTGFGNVVIQRISTIFFEWQDTDRASLLCLLAVSELLLHWTWAGFTYLNHDSFVDFVVMEYIGALWLGSGFCILVFLVLMQRFKKIKNNPKKFFYYQVFMVAVYVIYIDIAIVLIGQELLFTGTSFVGSTIIGLLLVNRKIIWWGFLFQCLYIVLFAFSSHFSIHLPSLRRLPEYFDIVSHSRHYVYDVGYDHMYVDSRGVLFKESMAEASRFYWRMSYMYLLLPKVITIVYMVKVLLELIEQGQEDISYRAKHDYLTGLMNKSSIYDSLHQQAFDKHNGNDLCVVMIDLDYFKMVNDKYGHGVGDVVLQKAAALFQQHLPPSGLLGRYGGEEFLLVLPNCTQTQAVDIANELKVILNENILSVEGHDIQLTASFGVASICGNCLSTMLSITKSSPDRRQDAIKSDNENDLLLKQLIKNADTALYQAKYYGRNRVMWGTRIECLHTALKDKLSVTTS